MSTDPDRDAGRPSPTPAPIVLCIGDVEVVPDTGALSGPRGHAKLDPKVMDVLVCLAVARGELVSRDHIMECVWPGVVVTDFALSRCIYQLRKGLGDVSAATTSPVETLPKRGYRLTWTVNDAQPAPRATTARATKAPVRSVVASLLAIIVTLGAAYFYGVQKNWFDGFGKARAVRVSVLPLEDLSENAGHAVFVNGLTREIMHEIAAIPGVIAVGQLSVFELATAGFPTLETATRLNADFVLSGNVMPVGDARRILIDLRSVPGGELVWSHSYLVERDAPFVMLPELARSVATELNFSTDPDEFHRFTENLAAFEAYFAAGKAESRLAARQLLRQAVELDPSFAEAWDWLAAMEVMPVWNGQATVEDAWSRAKPYLDRALELNPDLPSAHITLGRFQRELGDMDAAIASFRRALQLDPGNGWASANLGLVLRFTGRYEEALGIHDMAVAMDPLSPAAQGRLGTSYWFVGDFESAARHYQIANDLDPADGEIYDSWAGMLAVGLGRYDQALSMIRRKMTLPGEPTVRTLNAAGHLSSMLGMDADALEYWRRGLAINPDYVPIHENLVNHYLARGDDDAVRREAFEAINLDPGDYDAHLALAILDIEEGHAKAFASRIRAAYPAWFDDPPPDVDADRAGVALLVALVYDVEGMEDDKRLVLRAIDEAFQAPHAWQYMTLATVHAMRHEPLSALHYLRASPPGRVRDRAPVMMRDPWFASLRDNGDFRGLLAGHLHELRSQAARVADGIPRSRDAVSMTMH